MKNRIELAAHFKSLGFTKGAEVGVCTGRYSKILLQSIPGLQLLGVDPYLPYGGGGSFRQLDTHYGNFQQAHQLVEQYPNYLLVVARGHDVAQWLPDGSLDFVFIDGIHDYENAYRDITDWAPKVRRGGIVSGHDYYLTERMRVKEAVDDYAREHGIEVQSTEWDEEAFRDDRQPDWWWTVA